MQTNPWRRDVHREHRTGDAAGFVAGPGACPDVVLWDIDLKGGMELRPWAPCLARLATTLDEATELLADAVAVLDARAHISSRDNSRVWEPTPSAPALVIVIDEADERSPSTCSPQHSALRRRPWEAARCARR